MQDFLVIGGGVAGLSAAAALAELGRVTLLERESAPGYHSSGRSAAMWDGTYGLPSTVALNRASHPALLAAGVLAPRGLLLVAGPDRAEAFARDLATKQMTPIGLSEARSLCPILDPQAVTLAAFHDGAQDIDTDRLMQHYAARIRAQGGQIVTRAGVTAISRTSPGWAVSAGVVYEGRNLINAAGAWADRIAALAGLAPLGLTPFRRSMARIAAPPGHDPAGWPMLLGAGEDWYMKPDAGALIVSPAEEDPSTPHDAWADDMVLAEGLARYEAMVTEPVTRLISNWAGLRTFAPDRVLVIGPDAREPAFFWLAGQGGYGFQTCPAASRLAADLIGGRGPELAAGLVAALSPARFG